MLANFEITILKKLAYFYIVLHTKRLYGERAKNVRRSLLSWKILKIKNAPRGKNEKLRTKLLKRQKRPKLPKTAKKGEKRFSE
jgi:hypothetical protein